MASVIDALLQGLPTDPFGNPLAPGGAAPAAATADAGAPYNYAGTTQSPAQTLSAALAAAGNPPEGSTAFNIIKYPNSLWGGNDNVASHTPPDWLKALVASYLANPSRQRWEHIVNQTGVQAPFNVPYPDWLKIYLEQAMGPEPGGGASGMYNPPGG